MSCCGGHDHNKHGERNQTGKKPQQHHHDDYTNDSYRQHNPRGHGYGHVGGGCCGGRGMLWIIGILILVGLLYRFF